MQQRYDRLLLLLSIKYIRENIQIVSGDCWRFDIFGKYGIKPEICMGQFVLVSPLRGPVLSFPRGLRLSQNGQTWVIYMLPKFFHRLIAPSAGIK